jgi:hypothetical protein
MFDPGIDVGLVVAPALVVPKPATMHIATKIRAKSRLRAEELIKFLAMPNDQVNTVKTVSDIYKNCI